MNTKLRLRAVAIGTFLAPLLALAPCARAAQGSEVREVLDWFSGCGEEVAARKEFFGRSPATEKEAAEVLDKLPAFVTTKLVKGPAAGQRVARVLSSLAPHFAWSGVVKAVVFENEMPWAGMYGRSVIALSTGALELLCDEELRAVLSHELSHNLWPYEYKCAHDNGDARAVRVIELKCDALGLFYHYKAGGSLKTFLTALQKMNDHPLVPAPAAADEHPTLEARRRLAVEVAKSLRIPE